MFEYIENVKKYCNSLTEYKRYKTREVFIGDVALGANNPIRIQSMTTTNTMDTKATVEQTIRMVNSGCEYVRITAPSKLEAQNLELIKNELRKKGYNVPLIADIHFTPNAAEIAARIVEKVRINPGNYIDRKKFQSMEYTDSEYYSEIEKIRERFSPLVKICKEYGTCMRIGTNHGSLSDRIMSRYGDTPLGMIESALEFVRICEELDYYNIVLSMKASNPQIMIQAYRMLIKKMESEGMNYPLHIGVTEAGGGEDGRIKSAVGIGTLLEDGIGDTVRVSLTEDPEFEAPVAIQLVKRYDERANHKPIKPVEIIPYDPFNYTRRHTFNILNIGEQNVPRVITDFGESGVNDYNDLSAIGYYYDSVTDKWNMSDGAPDFIYLGKNEPSFNLPNGLRIIYDYKFWVEKKNNQESFPLFSTDEYSKSNKKSKILNFVAGTIDNLNDSILNLINADKTAVIILETINLHGMPEQRRVFIELLTKSITNPVILKRNYYTLSFDQLRLYAATDLGGLMVDGFGDGVWANAESIKELSDNHSKINENILVNNLVNRTESKEKAINRVLFGVLQATRTRISKTEYIACPSCGRTLFDLQETTERIRQRTEHLKGVKIAIMGCIVNGPGEMADADYGYVGSGIGKINLYRGKDIVRRNIPSEQAVDNLIEIIKEDNNWIIPK
ncbi:MAG: (E)-4-hydroxy-3-methylbut-2-enyl-diphosphate synthase [Ignavibacteriaceae bacterium]